MSEITIKQAYKVMQAACGIEVGDKVKVLRMPSEGKELGWNYNGYGAIGQRRKAVGERLKVINIDYNGILLSVDVLSYPWPFFCLELVEKAKPELPADVTFTKEGLKVGGIFLSKDTIRENLDL